jgi:hypothetical protein
MNQRSLSGAGGGLDARKRPTDPHQNAMEEVARLSPVFDVRGEGFSGREAASPAALCFGPGRDRPRRVESRPQRSSAGPDSAGEADRPSVPGRQRRFVPFERRNGRGGRRRQHTAYADHHGGDHAGGFPVRSGHNLCGGLFRRRGLDAPPSRSHDHSGSSAGGNRRSITTGPGTRRFRENPVEPNGHQQRSGRGSVCQSAAWTSRLVAESRAGSSRGETKK